MLMIQWAHLLLTLLWIPEKIVLLSRALAGRFIHTGWILCRAVSQSSVYKQKQFSHLHIHTCVHSSMVKFTPLSVAGTGWVGNKVNINPCKYGQFNMWMGSFCMWIHMGDSQTGIAISFLSESLLQVFPRIENEVLFRIRFLCAIKTWPCVNCIMTSVIRDTNVWRVKWVAGSAQDSWNQLISNVWMVSIADLLW